MITRALHRLRVAIALARMLVPYLLLGILKQFVTLRRLARWAWCPSAGTRDRDLEHRLAMSVLRLSQLLAMPDRDCLQRSLLLYRVLSRAGADPTLLAGFHRMNGRIIGHAWVIVDGCPVIESEGDLLRFSPAFGFGSRGALVQPRADAHAR
jgi:hypothetical protein